MVFELDKTEDDEAVPDTAPGTVGGTAVGFNSDNKLNNHFSFQDRTPERRAEKVRPPHNTTERREKRGVDPLTPEKTDTKIAATIAKPSALINFNEADCEDLRVEDCSSDEEYISDQREVGEICDGRSIRTSTE